MSFHRLSRCQVGLEDAQGATNRFCRSMLLSVFRKPATFDKAPEKPEAWFLRWYEASPSSKHVLDEGRRVTTGIALSSP